MSINNSVNNSLDSLTSLDRAFTGKDISEDKIRSNLSEGYMNSYKITHLISHVGDGNVSVTRDSNSHLTWKIDDAEVNLGASAWDRVVYKWDQFVHELKIFFVPKYKEDLNTTLEANIKKVIEAYKQCILTDNQRILTDNQRILTDKIKPYTEEINGLDAKLKLNNDSIQEKKKELEEFINSKKELDEKIESSYKQAKENQVRDAQELNSMRKINSGLFSNLFDSKTEVQEKMEKMEAYKKKYEVSEGGSWEKSLGEIETILENNLTKIKDKYNNEIIESNNKNEDISRLKEQIAELESAKVDLENEIISKINEKYTLVSQIVSKQDEIIKPESDLAKADPSVDHSDFPEVKDG